MSYPRDQGAIGSSLSARSPPRRSWVLCSVTPPAYAGFESVTNEGVAVRDFHDIEILRGVSHVVAPRDPTMLLRLSEAELPLGGGVGEILATQVDGGLHDAQAKVAAFVARSDERVCGACKKLLGPRPRLVELSQQIARSLYASPRMTSGSPTGRWRCCCAKR